MTGIEWKDDQARRSFAEEGVSNLEQLVNLDRGELVTTARTRKLWKLELGGEVWYLKVQDLSGHRFRVAKWPSYVFRGTSVGREARTLALLSELGFNTPRVAAHGERRGVLFPRYAALLTRAYERHIDLVRYLERQPDADAARRTVECAHQLVDRAHGLGIVLLGAKYRNILVPPEGADAWTELALVDQPDLRRSTSARLRDKDLRLMRLDRDRYAGSNS